MLLGKDITSHYLQYAINHCHLMKTLQLTVELSLDQPCIFLPAHSSTGSTPSVTGRFCLSLTRAISFKAITVRVIGTLKTPRYGLFFPETREEVTFQQRQPLACSKANDSFTMPEGNYEFLFEFPLVDILFDTIIGPKHNYHTYRVEAVIERWMRRDLVVSEPVRIYKYPRLGRHDLAKAMISNSTQGIGYYFSIPDTLVQHGSAFPVDCWFVIPQGATLSSLRLRVIEKHELSFPATAAESAKYDTHFITHGTTHIIFEKEQCYPHSFPEAVGNEELDVNERQISIAVGLPRAAEDCSQSYSSKCIKINHFLVIKVEFKDNNASSVKQIAEAIPLHIYMKPDGGNDLSGCRFQPQCQEREATPPPLYGKHELDRMISAPPELRLDLGPIPPVVSSVDVR
ncbi:hypothetical protein BDW69DRAFT_182463 [Aspergillus filifer]